VACGPSCCDGYCDDRTPSNAHYPHTYEYCCAPTCFLVPALSEFHLFLARLCTSNAFARLSGKSPQSLQPSMMHAYLCCQSMVCTPEQTQTQCLSVTCRRGAGV